MPAGRAEPERSLHKIRPGDATVMDVEATLYPRQAIELLGIAPLTSMFLFGPNDRQGVDDSPAGARS